MDMNGEQRIPVGQQAVWEALNDLEVLKACIPGCESIEKVTETEHHVTLTAAVGPVKAKFKGKMHLGDLNPPHSYRIGFEGQGGVAGFAKGEAQVALKPDGADTLMNYTVHAQVGGKLAQVGSRLIDAAAKKLADEFFSAFNARVAPAAAEAAAPKPAAGVPIWIWIAAAIAAIVAVLFSIR
ncbi:MAG: carbon monoxide dehydrogenase [Rhodocyclaceae bacterium]|jgi:carbon monoxide dehydrogenase subunit G|nr:carbon monoxide dehydrogenase subunit G [Zoogloeaceae bacterium]MBP9653284.1 carbon monoxide dehydrogenase subunit G [Rhodocyclaceae bacterium]MCQ3925109.1 carbon monoxide dehydrogenase [Rhodocyclaceae bacterium]HNQ57866.1 carbon monoxide dehydrogenase subunit G [Candidatus Desulfobacillus denitrificans]HNT62439.1 carbon monoxide dehydrogenase subunit G [Candidatus Desulfobacillus denitrificans]